jgi:hypothetical protein
VNDFCYLTWHTKVEAALKSFQGLVCLKSKHHTN